MASSGTKFSWEYVIALATKGYKNESLIHELKGSGKKLGLAFKVVHRQKNTFVKVGVSLEGLGLEAENLGLLKPLKNVANEDKVNGKKAYSTTPFIYAARCNYNGWGSFDFFSFSERAHIAHCLLGKIASENKDNGIACALLPTLLHEEKIEAIFPPHDHDISDKLFREACLESRATGYQYIRSYWFRLFSSPIHGIEEYYGSAVAFYFAWLDFFTVWLIFPAVAGFSLWYFRGEGYTVDNSPRIPLFSMFVIFWSAFFLKYWDRYASALACTWGTLDAARREEVRPQFHGKTVISLVTGKKEIHFGFSDRLPRYVASCLATALMLSIAFGIMCLFLNLEGYVHRNSPIYIKVVARLAEPGGLFFTGTSGEDGDYAMSIGSQLFGFIPVILHAVIIMLLNSLYRVVAETLTEFENHRTEHEFENSIIIKRFLFEAFDCYIALFYIAFYELDPIALRQELIGLYTVDSFRRVVCECIIPLTLQKLREYFRKRKDLADDAKHKKSDGDGGGGGGDGGDGGNTDGEWGGDDDSQIVDELLDEYEQFDDYLEMVIEYGYITLFASAFPLAPILSMLCNLIELRSDMFKLVYVCRRPHVNRVRNIGIWRNIMYVLFTLSIVSNCFLFGFTTEQMMVWIPSWFQLEKELRWDGAIVEEQDLAKGKGRYVVFMVFALEHILLVCCGLILAVIPSEPEWVRIDRARREYEREEALRKSLRIR